MAAGLQKTSLVPGGSFDMARKSRQPNDVAERNLQGLPPREERQGPSPPAVKHTAWTRGDGGMEGPAGWHSEFGRAGFASTGEHAPKRGDPPNPLDSKRKAEPRLAATPTEPSPQQGDPTDAWDKPYGDASWGGQATKSTPEQERQADSRGPQKPRRRSI